MRAVAAHPRVREAEAAVREASTALRWSEALRRRWREARAEAAVRGAVASAGVEGAVVPAHLLREAVAARTLTEALTGDPALVRAAVVHAETASARPFTAGNAAVGRLLARHLVTRDGLEPTGVAVADLWASRAPGGYAQALAAYASGTGEGAVDWVLWQAEALLVGIEEGLRLCRAVQAGTTAAG
nr:Fic family protein [Actinomyces sp. 217892]